LVGEKEQMIASLQKQVSDTQSRAGDSSQKDAKINELNTQCAANQKVSLRELGDLALILSIVLAQFVARGFSE
jgi:hypothetical protein